MYHRYRSDGNGQFTRRTVGAPPSAPSASSAPPHMSPPQKPLPPPHFPPPAAPPSPPPEPEQGLLGPLLRLPLLRRLLPNMDSGDLLLLLILLLLLSEGTQDASTAAMTIAIFLFLQ